MQKYLLSSIVFLMKFVERVMTKNLYCSAYLFALTLIVCSLCSVCYSNIFSWLVFFDNHLLYFFQISSPFFHLVLMPKHMFKLSKFMFFYWFNQVWKLICFQLFLSFLNIIVQTHLYFVYKHTLVIQFL